MGKQQQGGQQQQKQAKAAMKSRVSEKGYITHRVGEDVRSATHKEGALIMHGKEGQNTIFVDKSGCWSTKPIQIKKCSIPLDNK
jgi:hypothetical protein